MILWNCRQTFVGAACWYQQGWACTDVSLACTSHSQKKILSNSNRCCIISSFHRHISQIQSGGGTDYGVTGQLTRGDVTMTGDRDIKMRSHDSILDSWRHDCHRVLMTSHVSKIRGEIKILHSTHYQHPTLGSRHFLRPASCYLRGRKSQREVWDHLAQPAPETGHQAGHSGDNKGRGDVPCPQTQIWNEMSQKMIGLKT